MNGLAGKQYTLGIRAESARIVQGEQGVQAVVDVAALGRLDVAGAYLIERTLRESPVGDVDRAGEVKEVRGTEDSPLYVVAWDDGHEGICSPGPETKVHHTAGR